MIRKKIIKFRPYTSPDELLEHRIMRRAVYFAIKNAITVR